MARLKNEQKTYLLAAIASTTGFTTLPAAGVVYRFVWLMPTSGQIPYPEDFRVCRHHCSYRHGPVTSGGCLRPCHFRMAVASGAMASCPWLWIKARIRSSRSFSSTSCNRDGAFWIFRPRSRSGRVRTTMTTRRLN